MHIHIEDLGVQLNSMHVCLCLGLSVFVFFNEFPIFFLSSDSCTIICFQRVILVLLQVCSTSMYLYTISNDTHHAKCVYTYMYMHVFGSVMESVLYNII